MKTGSVPEKWARIRRMQQICRTPSSTANLYSNYIIFCSKLSMCYCHKICAKSLYILCKLFSGFQAFFRGSSTIWKFTETACFFDRSIRKNLYVSCGQECAAGRVQEYFLPVSRICEEIFIHTEREKRHISFFFYLIFKNLLFRQTKKAGSRSCPLYGLHKRSR